MKRRNFVAAASVLAGGVAVPMLAADRDKDGDRDHDHEHDHEGPTGPLASATVSFGEWHTEPELDRFLVATPVTANVHVMSPFEATIKKGGSVNFIISGFHVLTVYAPATRLEDINGTLTKPIPGAPEGFPPVVDDPLHRVYRGVNPFDLPQGTFGPQLDRVEAVNFSDPGRYLVVCTFVPHFNDRMHGYVRVVR